MKSCVMIPTVKINGEEIESKLFKDLSTIIKSRNDVKDAWALFQIPGFGENFGLKKVNGEFLAEDVIRTLELDKVLERKLSKTYIEKKAGFKNDDGSVKVYNNYNDAVAEAEEFNKSSNSYSAIVSNTKNGFTIAIFDKDANQHLEELQVFNSTLNNKLLSILRELGFDVEVIEGLQQNGIFNPTDSEKNAENLKKIIRIAKGTEGEKAFPEEFAHTIIAGLRQKPLIERALESIDDTQIEETLGEDFIKYQELYNNDKQLLKEEAFGKMLASEIINDYTNDNLGFFNRVWNFIKSIFKNASEGEVNDAMSTAKLIAKNLAHQVLNDPLSTIVSKDDILDSKTMYAVKKTSEALEKMAKECHDMLALLMKDKAAKSNKGLYDKKDREAYSKVEKDIESKKHVDACCDFLKDALRNIEDFDKQLTKLEREKNYENNPNKIRLMSSTLVSLKNYIATYKKQIKKMAGLDKTYSGLDMQEKDAKRIAEVADKVLSSLNKVEQSTIKLTVDLVKAFLRPYWKDKVVNTAFIENQLITLDTLMDKGFNDITFADSMINSIAEASDILLALMAKVAIHQQDLRDDILLQDDAFIRECERKLREAGFNDTLFMYVFGENGIPTGDLISDRNTAAYEKARQEYSNKLDKEKISAIKKIFKLQKWERDNTETITKTFNGEEIEVVVPKAKDRNGNLLFGYPEGQSPVDKLAPAQREYYDNMMALKAEREKAIPKYKRNLYKAVQKRTDFIEELSKSITNPKELFNKCWEKLKDNLVRRSDDTEFGELVKEGEQLILLNAQGKPLKQVPVFYLNPLDDMSQLSTDFGASMRAFSACMLNYSMMNEILPQMQLLNDVIQNRPVVMHRGGAVLKGIKKIFGQPIEQEYTKPGSELKIGEASEFVLDKMFYGIHKLDEGTWKVRGVEIDTAKMLDFLKSYTSIVGMGFNLYSGISNLTMGGAQMMIEAAVNENFNFKDLAKAHIDYDKDVFGCLAEINSIKRENKLSLLMDKFDALESFYDNIKSKSFYKNAGQRLLENSSVMILNEIGEHRLHNVTMLAMLEHTKVLLNGEEISLYDAYEVSKERKNEDGTIETVPAYLKLKDGVTKLDGTEFTQEDFLALKRKISRVNRRLHGAYSEAHKGAAHRKAVGRLVLQFRQWMPGFYSNRFAGMFSGSYHDIELDDTEEGYYVTMFKLAGAIMKDLSHLKFEIATNYKNLTPHQKKNIGRAGVELGFLVLLYTVCAALGSIKDKESTWSEKMLYYQMLRLKLEVGAGFPLHPDFLDNIWTLMQSPAAAIRILNNLTDLLKFNNIFVEIQTGRYQGWSRYFKDFTETLPLYGNVRKAYDLAEEDYMFNIYNKTN